tara:strand:+ start:1344 stop:1550 length:207 start_codon:yes stop_codon:yes gene_type:complete
MTTEDLIRLFNKETDVLIEANIEALSNGSASEYAAYTGLVGRIRGLRESKRILGEIIDDWLKEERQED